MIVSDKDFIKQRTEVLNKFGILWLEDLKKDAEESPLGMMPKLPVNVVGMIILGIILKFPITGHFLPYENPARQDSIKKTGDYLKEIANLMREGKWESLHHVPPTIEWRFAEQFQYHTGHITKLAAESLDAQDLYLVVVEFVDAEGCSADFWRKIWASNENLKNDAYVKLPRTDKDVIDLVVGMVNEHEVKINNTFPGEEPTIDKTLECLEITAEPAARLKAVILGKLGYAHLAVEPKDDKAMKKEVKKLQQKHPDKFVTGASYSMKKQPKRDMEVAKKVAYKFVEDPQKFHKDNCYGLVGVAGRACLNIDNVREYKEGEEKLIEADRQLWRDVDKIENDTELKFGWNSRNIKQMKSDSDIIDLNE
jgi:hypothetical protein